MLAASAWPAQADEAPCYDKPELTQAEADAGRKVNENLLSFLKAFSENAGKSAVAHDETERNELLTRIVEAQKPLIAAIENLARTAHETGFEQGKAACDQARSP
jgi:hypothetical protein